MDADIASNCMLMLKLNGAACTDDDDDVVSGANRRLTFYRICGRLAAKLQSLFVPLVGQIAKDVCRVLKHPAEGKHLTCLLVYKVVICATRIVPCC